MIINNWNFKLKINKMINMIFTALRYKMNLL